MSTIYHKDKRSGITYVYESESYWDKEKKQPRSHRKLIGKLDESTGEVVPTDGRGRKRSAKKESADADTSLCGTLRAQIREKDLLISRLAVENTSLKKELLSMHKEISAVLAKHKGE